MIGHIPITLTIVIAIAVLEIIFHRFQIHGISERETWLDIGSLLQSAMVVGPLMAYGLAAIETRLLPMYAGYLAATPVLLQFVAFVIFDDLVQYWYHRCVHRSKLLWPLHLPHHSAPYMGIRMVHRNGFFYALLFPNLWISGVLVYLGFGDVYLAYTFLKAIVTLSAHSELRWDQWLYRRMPRLGWIIERTISTPATHFAHHAAVADDGVGHYDGNFANLFFFWDLLFGTALISRRYPQQFGVPGDQLSPHQPWYQLMLYPIFRAPRSGSAVAVPSVADARGEDDPLVVSTTANDRA